MKNNEEVTEIEWNSNDETSEKENEYQSEVDFDT